MSSKMSIIIREWDRWLDRYVPARNLAANDEAKQAEIDAHIRVIAIYAPEQETDAWLGRVTDALDRAMKTSAWPRVSEIEAVCMAIRREDAMIAPKKPGSDSGNSGIDPFRIAANRIQAGQPVGEGYLWGRSAVALLRRGFVTQAQIKDRRDDAIKQMATVWGPEVIAERIKDLESMHAEGVRLEDGARRKWAEDRANAERRASDVDEYIHINRMAQGDA